MTFSINWLQITTKPILPNNIACIKQNIDVTIRSTVESAKISIWFLVTIKPIVSQCKVVVSSNSRKSIPELLFNLVILILSLGFSFGVTTMASLTLSQIWSWGVPTIFLCVFFSFEFFVCFYYSILNESIEILLRFSEFQSFYMSFPFRKIFLMIDFICLIRIVLWLHFVSFHLRIYNLRSQ